MATTERHETSEYQTKYGKLLVKNKYIQIYDITGQQIVYEGRIETTLHGGRWLTEDMAEEFMRLIASGYHEKIPDWLILNDTVKD